MFSNRDEIRRAYAAAWAKARAGKPLAADEQRIAEVVRDHPEYQRIVESGEAAVEAEFPPEAGAANPFLHMGFHIAIREQVAIDRPPGIRDIFERLAAKRGGLEAEHAMIECLAETLWEAQRENRPPDDAVYFERLRRLAADTDLR
ncbi:MAG: DUF1841 family protein [Gammaproteobacteria bacterium]|nr:DUF1841 family protein [Gammaproteobacteria bacterium]